MDYFNFVNIVLVNLFFCALLQLYQPLKLLLLQPLVFSCTASNLLRTVVLYSLQPHVSCKKALNVCKSPQTSCVLSQLLQHIDL